MAAGGQARATRALRFVHRMLRSAPFLDGGNEFRHDRRPLWQKVDDLGNAQRLSIPEQRGVLTLAHQVDIRAEELGEILDIGFRKVARGEPGGGIKPKAAVRPDITQVERLFAQPRPFQIQGAQKLRLDAERPCRFDEAVNGARSPGADCSSLAQ